MAGRNDIDWEAIEIDYRIGSLSNVQIAKKHRISRSQLQVKAREMGWAKDLSKTVEAATRAAMIEQAKTKAEAIGRMIGQQSGTKFVSGVEAAVMERVAILSKHQDAIAVSVGVAIAMQRELAVISESIPELKILAEATKDSDPGLSKNLLDLTRLSTRALTAKTIVETLTKAIAAERQAHGITDNDGDGSGGNDIDALLLQVDEELRRSGQAQRL